MLEQGEGHGKRARAMARARARANGKGTGRGRGKGKGQGEWEREGAKTGARAKERARVRAREKSKIPPRIFFQTFFLALPFTVREKKMEKCFCVFLASATHSPIPTMPPRTLACGEERTSFDT